MKYLVTTKLIIADLPWTFWQFIHSWHPYNMARVNKLCKKFKEGQQLLISWSPDISSRINLYVWWILWINYLATIFSRFNIPCKHAFRVMVVTISGEKLSTQTPDPSWYFLSKKLWADHQVIYHRSPVNTVIVMMCLIK